MQLIRLLHRVKARIKELTRSISASSNAPLLSAGRATPTTIPLAFFLFSFHGVEIIPKERLKSNILRFLIRRPVQQRLVQVGVLVTSGRGQTNPERHPDLVALVLDSHAGGHGRGHERPGGLGDVGVTGRGSGVEAVSEGPRVLGDGGGAEGQSQRDDGVGATHDDDDEDYLGRKNGRIASQSLRKKKKKKDRSEWMKLRMERT